MIKILMLSLLIIFFSNYAMEDMSIADRVFQKTLIQEIIPKLFSADKLLFSDTDFEKRLVRFSDTNFLLKSVLCDQNNEDRLFLLTAFEDALENFSSVQSLMLVNKNLYQCIKTYQDKGIIDAQYKNIALKLKRYDMSNDIYKIFRFCFVANYNLEIALEQLVLINDHSKTLNFFSCKQFYEDSEDYTYQLGHLINWLISMKKRRSFDFFNDTIYFRSSTQHELVLTKIIKNFAGTFNAGRIVNCRCANYIANVKTLLYPEIITMINGKYSFWEYNYTLVKNENSNSETIKD
jgi:hypothetical protein